MGFDSQKHKGLSQAPKQVVGVKRLSNDLLALSKLMAAEEPAVVLVRGKSIAEVVYGFGDASGGGFGTTWEEEEKGKIKFRMGVWSEGVRDNSSNFKELNNLVESLEDKGRDGSLVGKEVFLCMNNSTCEGP